MKLTVLGRGGVHSVFLVKSLVYDAHHIGLTEMVFLDNSADSLAIFGEIARHVFDTIRPDIQFGTTTNPVVVLQDANYIVTTLRAGDDEGRIRGERVVLQHNTLGQETTGIGGFATTMHSIPATLRCCRLIEKHAAEGAILFNFTSPSDLVTETIVRSGFKHRVYGICNVPSELIRELPAILGCEECDLNVGCYGLNHSSWFIHFTVRGRGVTERLIASPGLCQKATMRYLFPELVRLCDNQLLNEYLHYYHY